MIRYFARAKVRSGARQSQNQSGYSCQGVAGGGALDAPVGGVAQAGRGAQVGPRLVAYRLPVVHAAPPPVYTSAPCLSNSHKRAAKELLSRHGALQCLRHVLLRQQRRQAPPRRAEDARPFTVAEAKGLARGYFDKMLGELKEEDVQWNGGA